MSLINLVAAICLQLPHPNSDSPPAQSLQFTFSLAQPLQLAALQGNPAIPSSQPRNQIALFRLPESEASDLRLLEPWDTSQRPPVHLLEPWIVGDPLPIIPVSP